MRFSDSNPIYLQIADLVCDGVLTGRYPAGERMSSVREMAVALEVNPNTVQRAYTTLQDWGLIETRRGLGYSVAANAADRALDRKRHKLSDEEVPRLLDYLRILNMSVDDLHKLCAQAQDGRRASGTDAGRPGGDV